MERELETKVADIGGRVPEWSEGEILRMLGHDLKTPLNGVSGFLELLDGTELTAEQRDHVETARQCAENLRATLESILECARLDSGKLIVSREPVDIAELLKGIAHDFHPHVRETDVTLAVSVSDDFPNPILLDRTKTRQIIENIVGNAVKFTTAGAITIRAEAAITPTGIVRSPSLIKFTIEDTGIGIRDEEISHVFAPFFRSNHGMSSPGIGLGLAIVEKLVATLEGSLNIKSALDVGTTVTVMLPFSA